MATAITETEQQNGELVYSVVLGAGEEDDDAGEIMQVVREHLDAAARDGTKLRIELSRVRV